VIGRARVVALAGCAIVWGVAGAESIGFMPTERLLAHAEIVDGIRFPAGTKLTLSGGPAPARLLQAQLSTGLTIGRIALPPGTLLRFADPARFGDRALPVEAELGAATTIQAIPCAKGLVRVHANGRLESAELAVATTLQSLAIPEHSYIWLDEQGRLKSINLSRPARLRSLWCSTTERVELHATGALDSARLAQPATLGTIPLPAETLLVMRADGTPELATFTAPDATETKIDFGEDGQPVKAELGAPITVNRVRFPAHSEIEFREGKPADVRFGEATTIQAIAIPAKTRASFRGDGTLEWIDLSLVDAPLVVRSLPCDPHALIRLHPSGALEEARLARNATVDGKALRAHTTFELDRDGRLLRTHE
jgi:hypothetical protein